MVVIDFELLFGLGAIKGN